MKSLKTPAPSAPKASSLLRNWLSMIGAVIILGSIFSFLLLFMLDTVAL